MKSLVRNLHIVPVTLPSPYHKILKPGGGFVVADTVANVVAALGGAGEIAGVLLVIDAVDANPTDEPLTGDYGLVGDITTIAPDDAAAAGTSSLVARADHKHAIVAAVAGTIA